MVPMADMLNHKTPMETRWQYSDEKKGFVIDATADIPRGGQVYDSYGEKCNNQFFLNYGFVCVPNEHNKVKMRLIIPDAIPQREAKVSLLNGQLVDQQFRAGREFRELEFEMLLSFARFVVFDEEPTHLYIAKTKLVAQIEGRRK